MQSHRGCTRQTIRLSVAFSTGVARSEHREGRGDRPGPGIQFNTPTANRYGRATRKTWVCHTKNGSESIVLALADYTLDAVQVLIDALRHMREMVASL